MFRAQALAAALLLASLLANPDAALGQRHGGHGAGSMPGVAGRPDGVQEKDTLKDFHEAMAVQATRQQIAEFQLLLQSSDAAKAAVESYLDQAAKTDSPVQSPVQLDQALQTARSGGRKFIEGFSPKQKSGLKDAIKRLEKADSSLDDEQKKFDQSLRTAGRANPGLDSRLETLDKSLTEFANQQLAIGREMGITLASGQDLTFSLPTVNRTVSPGNPAVEVFVAGVLSQTAAQGSQRTFKLELTGDLSDLQRNITELLRPQLETANPCGERLGIRQVDLTPSNSASVLLLKLHYERWSCMRLSGQTVSNELAESDGAVEIRLVPAIESANGLNLAATFGRIDAGGLMGDAMRSGDLGDNLRAKAAQSVLSVLRTAMDFKAVLPAVLQGSIALQNARFQPAGVGNVSLLLQGQVQLSDEQANVLARQLNQTLSAQGPPPQTAPQ